MITNRFNYSKALEVLLYVSSKVEYMYHTGKIIYFANRYHLEKYGRFVIDDRVIAMKNGPVLSNVYDMIKSARGDTCSYPEVEKHLTYSSGGSSLHKLLPKREANLDYLSESDIECLNEAINKIKGMSFRDLERFSHDSLYYTADQNNEISIDEIINHSINPDNLRKYLAG
ncbi:Panacea domain-containing protein [Gilliamella apicola]|uniref:Panacea domain-containing protein n=2 Tax=Gilliamella apicola TaxID=1196095 RepID=UPI00080EAA67|nr:Panacea domain-containing protein [Gilliamella apicola]OCG12621.1 hypothetical protein A9G14_04525 [Gilliamella apicola]ORF45819.1 hypothetical protein B5800_05525 [Gilliamella apicola]ORF48359.1 hypothetical protein B5803_11270 [Gilliamella apicola]ORF49685.1 hypothetical protein B5799_03965 [Gilliamella apicola]ORF53715.1 hypothetical protein B5798_08430 [Gilliamella apicola]